MADSTLALGPKTSASSHLDYRADVDGLRAIAVLSVAHKRVLLVQDVPVLPFDPVECVARPAFRAQVRTPCQHSRSAWRARSAAITTVLEAAAAGLPNVSLFDPARILCPREQCMAVHAGALLYTDRHHLSTAGATLVADGIIATLNSADL